MRRCDREARLPAVLGGLAVAAVLLFLCSMSSPLYPLNIWDDANCLLTVGRVMKAGGVLYRDIYEQKGPLLYLAHLLAACVSETDFLGVYLMETVFLAGTLVAAYRLMRLRAGRALAGAAAALFGACVLVGRAFARGDSAEEFCLPFLMTALYAVCDPAGREEGALSVRRMLLCGVLAGCVATIKYTALGLFVGLCLAQGLALLRQRRLRLLLASAGAFLLGMALPILPWVLYFTAQGALGDACTAYIHNNIFLYKAGGRALGDVLTDMARAARHNALWALPAAGGVVTAALSRQGGFARLAVPSMALAALAAVFLPGAVYPYYPLVLCVFAPLGLAPLVAAAQHMKRGRAAVAAGTGALALGAALLLSPNAFLRGVPLAETAQGRLAAQMEPGATLLQYSHLDDGLYLVSGALPQQKYFVLLNVAYGEMREALDGAVREGVPDYVLVSWRELPETFDGYALVACEMGYDDENRLNKPLYLYKRRAQGPEG